MLANTIYVNYLELTHVHRWRCTWEGQRTYRDLGHSAGYANHLREILYHFRY
jgi:hypothetical protein